MNKVNFLRFVVGLGCAAALICCGGGTQSEAILAESVDSGSDAAKDDTACCPHDPLATAPSGCTQLGGRKRADGVCACAWDFWCSSNWRVATDNDGCEVLQYDTRRPQQGEDSTCQQVHDAGEPDAP